MDNREATQIALFLETLNTISPETLKNLLSESGQTVHPDIFSIDFFRSFSPQIYKKIGKLIEEKSEHDYIIQTCKQTIRKNDEAHALANISDEENQRISTLVKTLSILQENEEGQTLFKKIGEDAIQASTV
jgi:hypothetical protein